MKWFKAASVHAVKVLGVAGFVVFHNILKEDCTFREQSLLPSSGENRVLTWLTEGAEIPVPGQCAACSGP